MRKIFLTLFLFVAFLLVLFGESRTLKASPAERRGFKIPQKNPEEDFSVNLRAFDQRIQREKK